VQFSANQTCRSLKGDFYRSVGNPVRVARETTRPIPAHFRFATVAIIIAHSEIGAVRAFLKQQNSVRPYTAVSIANSDDLIRPKTHLAGAIVDHYEIVARSVHLGEAQHVRTVAAAVLTRKRVHDCFARNLLFIPPAMRKLLTLLFVGFAANSTIAAGLNSLVLEQMEKMPSGGQYSVSHFAKIKLQTAAHFESGKFFVIPTKPYVSFCSGATYLVFIKAIEELRDRGQLQLDFSTLNQLIIRDQRDGEGVWGRWNANGPGTARLFHELGLGRNFTDFGQAQPGDFMKIFWSNNVGRRESGHSVIFLGTTPHPDGEYVRYWSSNIGMGYGAKEVPRNKIAYAIFSRLETPANLTRIRDVPTIDAYLASLLRKKSNFAEARQKCGI
jgi:hypothetical protein